MPLPTRTIYITKPQIPVILRDEYHNNASALFGSSRAANPGPGRWQNQDTAGIETVIEGAQTPTAQTTGAGDPRSVSDTLLPIAGRLFSARVKPLSAFGGAGNTTIHGFSDTATPSITTSVFGAMVNDTQWLANTTLGNFPIALNVLPFNANTYYTVDVIKLASNSGILIDGKLVYVDRGGFAPAAMFPTSIVALAAARRNASIDRVVVRDTPIRDLAVSRYTPSGQAYAADQMLNGDFTNWTGSVPNSWTVSAGGGPGDPEFTQVAPGNLHGGGGTGAANLFSSATANVPTFHQNSQVANGVIYFDEIDISAWGSGQVFARADNPGATPTIFQFTPTAATIQRSVYRGSTNSRIRIQALTNVPNDWTINKYTHQIITLNTANVMPSADCITDIDFTLPGSPVGGDRIVVFYRTSTPGDEYFNGMVMTLFRNAANVQWDLILDSYVAGAATRRITATSVATPTALRVLCFGNFHQIYTIAGTAITSRGSFTGSLAFDTAVGINVLTTPTVTQGQVAMYPVVDNARNEMIRKDRIA